MTDLSVGTIKWFGGLNSKTGRVNDFGFIDSSGGRMAGTQKLECEVTVRAGQVVWDLNGRAAPLWTDMPATPQGVGSGRRRATSRERE